MDVRTSALLGGPPRATFKSVYVNDLRIGGSVVVFKVFSNFYDVLLQSR